MAFPKEVTRITAHKVPKYQLYQPGFNEGNGCWLEGAWVTVTPDKFFKVAHEAMYGRVRTAKQHYRDPAVLPENLTPAQRQAWEFYSGDGTIYCQGAEGGVGGVSAALAAGKIRKDSVDWLRNSGRKVLAIVKMPDGSVVDQQALYGIPGGKVPTFPEIIQLASEKLLEIDRRHPMEEPQAWPGQYWRRSNGTKEFLDCESAGNSEFCPRIALLYGPTPWGWSVPWLASNLLPETLR